MNFKTGILMLIAFTATGISAKTKTHPVSEKNMSAYLMVYFKDDTHGIVLCLE